MRPTVQEVKVAARTYAGDPNGRVLTSDVLQPYLNTAYSEIFRAMQATQSQRVRQETYYDLPAYTMVLDPATANIANLGEIETVEERGGVTEVAITGAVPGAGFLAVTAPGHGLSTGDQVVQYGIGGLTIDANGLFAVTVLSSSAYKANGCTATGTYTSGGTMTKSAEEFYELVPQQRILYIDSSPQTILRIYAWEGDLLRFPLCSALRQLRITYSLSGQAPSVAGDTIPIDDSKDFLSFRMCGLALQARGNREKAATFNEMAVGPEWDKGVEGGILAQLLSSGVRNLQRLPPAQRTPPAFRSRRRYLIW